MRFHQKPYLHSLQIVIYVFCNSTILVVDRDWQPCQQLSWRFHSQRAAEAEYQQLLKCQTQIALGMAGLGLPEFQAQTNSGSKGLQHRILAGFELWWKIELHWPVTYPLQWTEQWREECTGPAEDNKEHISVQLSITECKYVKCIWERNL